MCKIYLTLSFCFLGRFGIVFFLIYIYGYGFHSIIQEERVCLSSGIVVFPKKKNTTLKVQVELRLRGESGARDRWHVHRSHGSSLIACGGLGRRLAT